MNEIQYVIVEQSTENKDKRPKFLGRIPLYSQEEGKRKNFIYFFE